MLLVCQQQQQQQNSKTVNKTKQKQKQKQKKQKRVRRTRKQATTLEHIEKRWAQSAGCQAMEMEGWRVGVVGKGRGPATDGQKSGFAAGRVAGVTQPRCVRNDKNRLQVQRQDCKKRFFRWGANKADS
jgi:hypothetical protein